VRSRVLARTVAAAAVTALGGLGLAGLAPSASAAMPAKAYDFNGDGYRDLAIGSPYGKVGTKTTAGFVSVIYGSSSGLNTAKKKVFTQNSTGVPGNAEAADHFGYSLASADFDGDGYGDLAIGAPDEDTGHGANAGLVTILWGSPSGLTTIASANEEFGDPGTGHRWGESLAVGDLEHDGSPELFITIPGVSNFAWFFFNGTGAAAAAAGGSPARPGGTVTLPRKAGASAQSLEDVTNSVVAAGDVTGDGHDDVVYGWYDADWSEPSERRGFVVFPGTAAGDIGDGTPIYTEAASVAVGDFEGDGFEDVAVGQPSATRTGGQVTVFKGSATGVSAAATTAVHQDTAGVPDVSSSGDQFGANIAVGDVNKDGKADLAVGAPGDNVGGITDSGRSFVLFGSAGGLTGSGAQTVSQSTTNVPGSSEKSDHFGYQVTLLDHNRDGTADLVVGAPTENGNDGAITLFKGRTGGILPVSGAVQIGSGTFGVSGKTAEIGRRLGR
jgi:FG-GAP repeat protein